MAGVTKASSWAATTSSSTIGRWLFLAWSSVGFSVSAHEDSLCLNDLSSLSFTHFFPQG